MVNISDQDPNCTEVLVTKHHHQPPLSVELAVPSRLAMIVITLSLSRLVVALSTVLCGLAHFVIEA